MAINVSALNGYYNDELRFEIASRAVLEANDVKYLNVFDNVNGSMLLSTIDTDIVITNDECDTRNDSGATIFAGNTLATSPLLIYNDICNKKLQRYFLGKKGASEQGIDGELMTALMNNKITKSMHEIAKIRWQGVDASATYKWTTQTGNLSKASGYIQRAYEASATTVNVARTAITQSNAIVVVDTISASIPANTESKENKLHLSPSDFRNYMMARRNAGWLDSSANYDSNAQGVSEIYHAGTDNLVIVKNNGLENVASGTGILTYDENLALGCLKDPAAMDFKAWYSEDKDRVCFELYILQGVNFVHNEDVVVIR